jgi:hypothetical protein
MTHLGVGVFVCVGGRMGARQIWFTCSHPLNDTHASILAFRSRVMTRAPVRVFLL